MLILTIPTTYQRRKLKQEQYRQRGWSRQQLLRTVIADRKQRQALRSVLYGGAKCA